MVGLFFFKNIVSTRGSITNGPAPEWFLIVLGLSAVAVVSFFFAALRSFELWRRPDINIREMVRALASKDRWGKLDMRCALEIDERGITWEDPKKAVRYKHSKVQGIDRSDQFVFIYIDPDILYPVPVRINDTTRIDELIELIEEYSGVESRFIPA